MADIGIIGSGTIGLFVGGKLLNAGHQVHFLARSNFAALQDGGFKIDEKEHDGATRYHANIKVYDDLLKMPKQDYIILCTTVADNYTYLEKLKEILKPNTIIVTLQNGIHFETEIFNAVKPNKFLSGTCWIKGSKINPTHVRHDFGLKILLGEYPESGIRPPNSEIDNFYSMMIVAGFEMELLVNYLSAQLTKLAINLPFFGLMLHYGVKQAKIVGQHQAELLDFQKEIIDIGDKLGVEIDESYISEINTQLGKMPEADLNPDERNRFAKEISPNFENFFTFLGSRSLTSPKLQLLYESICSNTNKIS